MDKNILKFLFFSGLKPSFRVECGHTTGTSGGDRLAIDLILNVSRSKNSFDTCFSGTGNGFDITAFIQI
ncbi:hypothetical protein LEP1GSC137_4363 [Leptospira borgpetersenii str. Noumea 25]|uniref:Uncharacterized protein n=1 Tax=Leptospira borgpetersenii str. 200701203 TaxID=1193007 RepID=M3GC02_LEPBO|nr:hypothetical protein LEP1GSC123_1490 [Leptospira borgpetersenii str. 200701203]EMO08168.1 hypothetical protein LEP1GSC137_4363 [Leptospira borgpetersenii str. Noumea 25]